MTTKELIKIASEKVGPIVTHGQMRRIIQAKEEIARRATEENDLRAYTYLAEIGYTSE